MWLIPYWTHSLLTTVWPHRKTATFIIFRHIQRSRTIIINPLDRSKTFNVLHSLLQWFSCSCKHENFHFTEVQLQSSTKHNLTLNHTVACLVQLKQRRLKEELWTTHLWKKGINSFTTYMLLHEVKLTVISPNTSKTPSLLTPAAIPEDSEEAWINHLKAQTVSTPE